MALEKDSGAVVRRFWDRVWNSGDLSAIDDLVDDRFVNFGVRQPGAHAAMRHIVMAWRTAFPDLRFDLLEEILSDDTVVHRVVMRGTHRGVFGEGVGPARIMGVMPPTGRAVEVDQIHIHRVEGGRIVEHAATRNDLLMMHQLGVVRAAQQVSEADWRAPVTPHASP
jgi:predicted ester cyclase